MDGEREQDAIPNLESRSEYIDSINGDKMNETYTTRVIHYHVELSSYFHRDGKDKESFTLWKTCLQLAVNDCSNMKFNDLATILPTCLSGDALAYCISLSFEIQKDYDKTMEKIKEEVWKERIFGLFPDFCKCKTPAAQRNIRSVWCRNNKACV